MGPSLIWARQSSLSPEMALLLACARTHPTSEDSGRIQELAAQVIDWQSLILLARRQRTLPLLYHNLTSCCPDAVPPETLLDLHKWFLSHELRNHALGDALLQALKTLEAHGVQAIPIRGPEMAEAVYGDLMLRQFNDLDILVHPADALRGREALSTLGYRMWAEHDVPDAFYLRYGHHYALVLGSDHSIELELHWTFVEPYFGVNMGMAQVWSRLESSRFAGVRLPSLSPEDMLLMLCLHGGKHSWGYLSLLCDVAELLRARPGLNWDLALGDARRLGAERMCLLGLCLAEWLGATLPEPLSHRIKSDSTLQALSTQVCVDLFRPAIAGKASRARSSHLRFHLALRDSFWDKLQHILRLTFWPTGDDWLLLPLPPALQFVYYLLRPMRLIGKYLRGLVTSLCPP